jgi:hypothetical protein
MQGQPYLVYPDPQDGSCFYLKLGHPDQEAAALEVMRDEAGGWLGFRAGVADDRFLQANKKRAARLLLFNHNFGTNEHWEMLNPPQLPWTRAPCRFRHRRHQVCAAGTSLSATCVFGVILLSAYVPVQGGSVTM